MTDFLARVGDRINPVVVKEARQAVNSRLVAGTLLLFLAIQLIAMLLMLNARNLSNPDDLDLRAGRQVFTFVQGILLATCMLLIPALTGVRLAAERSDVNVDLLFISSLTPRAVLAGKLFAAAAVALLIFSACAPFMTFAYVLRGLDMPAIAVVLVADFLAVLLGTMFALFLAAIPANRGFRIILGLGGFITLCYLFGGAVALSAAFLHFEFVTDLGSWEFWAGFGGIAALVLGNIGLLFVWAVALISPPTANRALPVRAYTAGLWVATAAGCAAWSYHVGRPNAVLAWGVLSAVVFGFSFVFAVCERDGWGPRVARRIPRNPLLRFPALLLFSGAAGGIAFAALGVVGTLAAMAAWHPLTPAAGWPDPWGKTLQTAGLLAGYFYCYSMTAALLRRALRPAGFPPAYTWVLVMLLGGLGLAVPVIIQFALFDRPHYDTHDLLGLYLPNPAVTVDEISSHPDPKAALVWAFVGVWAAGATLLNAGWLLGQVANFRPPPAPAKGATA